MADAVALYDEADRLKDAGKPDEAVAKLQSAGVAYHVADRALCDLRGVREMTRFEDPTGYRHELFYAQSSELRSFKPPRKHAGFAADEQGIGHVILVVPALTDELEHFLFEVMGFKWFGGGSVSSGMKMGFYRPALSTRSHSIGYFQVPGKFGIQHIGLPVRELDDVGITLDIIRERRVPLQMTLGRHVQDPVISFYVFTPSGFSIEYLYEFGAWNTAAEMNPDKVSLWGHERVGPLMPTTVRSL